MHMCVSVYAFKLHDTINHREHNTGTWRWVFPQKYNLNTCGWGFDDQKKVQHEKKNKIVQHFRKKKNIIWIYL